MKQPLKLAGWRSCWASQPITAIAQDKIKIGVIVTLSGPAAVLGQQARDGFALAVKDLGGKMARPRCRGRGRPTTNSSRMPP